MLSSLRRATLLATMAVLGAGAMPTVMAQPALVSAAPRPVKAGKRGLFGGSHASARSYRGKNPAISAAQQKRNARKVRNVARNRRHHR
jgi:hypothetical protein